MVFPTPGKQFYNIIKHKITEQDHMYCHSLFPDISEHNKTRLQGTP